MELATLILLIIIAAGVLAVLAFVAMKRPALRQAQEATPGVIAGKIKPNVLAIAGMLTAIEFVLTGLLFVLVLRVLDLAEAVDHPAAVADGAAAAADAGPYLELVLTSAGIAALFAAWLIVIGSIIGGLISVMAQAAEEKPDKPPSTVPESFAKTAVEAAQKS